MAGKGFMGSGFDSFGVSEGDREQRTGVGNDGEESEYRVSKAPPFCFIKFSFLLYFGTIIIIVTQNIQNK